MYLALEPFIGKPEKIHGSGGFAQSDLWRQMLSDIFDTELHISQTVESSALGAVLLGRYALGEMKTLEEAAEVIGTAEINKPIPENVAIYDKLIPLYEKIGGILEAGYEDITAFQEEYN